MAIHLICTNQDCQRFSVDLVVKLTDTSIKLSSSLVSNLNHIIIITTTFVDELVLKNVR